MKKIGIALPFGGPDVNGRS